jgi:hypothetical protein
VGRLSGIQKRVDNSMKEEKRDVIKLFFDESIGTTAISKRLRQYYEEGAIHLSMLYYWIKEVKLARKVFSNILSSDDFRMAKLSLSSS